MKTIKLTFNKEGVDSLTFHTDKAKDLTKAAEWVKLTGGKITIENPSEETNKIEEIFKDLPKKNTRIKFKETTNNINVQVGNKKNTE